MSDSTNVLIILPPAENAGDGYGRALRAAFPQLQTAWAPDAAEAEAGAPDAEVILTFSPFITRRVAESARRLRWLQILGSGMDGIADLPLPSGVVITNGHGVQAIPVSEAALGLIFALSRGYRRLARNQEAHTWERWPSRLLHGKTVGIVGVGAIAEALAPKCRALGMRVIGVSSSPRSVEGFESIHPMDELRQASAESDFLVLLTPHTPATHHLIGAAVFAAMKPSACLVNVARGGVVDEAALVEALRSGAIAGAALDVFETQPLPKDSPLWAMETVIVSPHVAGLNEDYRAHIMPLLEANFRAFLTGDWAAMQNRYRPT
jgi:phosphoglycerate dehydrogenase-like enzyme